MRDIELSNKKKSSHGNLHTLYADGIEFVGLTNEVHSIHGGMDRLESMIATLMKKDEEENEEEVLIAIKRWVKRLKVYM